MVVDRSYYRTSTGADSSYLRGQANAHYVDDDATTTTATTALRLLYENNASSNNADGKSFTIMLTVLVALILVFFVICTYQVLRIWLCKCLCGRDYLQGTNSNAAVAAAGAASGSRDTTTMLVHGGRVFNLTGHQRRAVLEAIFSETSKAVTDQDVANEKRKKKKRKIKGTENADEDDDEIPMDAVEIPGVSTVGTDDSRDHQNLSPTDGLGNVESSGCCFAGSSPGTSATTNSSSSSPPPPQPGDISRCQTIKAVGNAMSSSPPRNNSDHNSPANFDDHSDLDSEDHLYQDSGSLSEDESSSNEEGLKRAQALLSGEDNHRDAAHSGFVFEMGMHTPESTPNVQDDEPQDGGESPSLHYLSIRGAPKLVKGGLGESGENVKSCNSLDVVPFGVASSASSSPMVVAVQGDPMESTYLILDDDSLDDGSDARRALFRETVVEASLGIPETGIVQNAAPKENSAEESKDEIEQLDEIPGVEQAASNESFGEFGSYITPSTLRVPVPLMRLESFTTVTSEYTFDDDSTTGDNVCPICLCGYKKGDMLVVSNHCTHCFHKDCILEWLEKHDDCPICRVNMVTDSEMSRAATSLVGKTRMYRAVASLQSSSSPASVRYRAQHPLSSHAAAAAAAAANGSSPLRGTVRRYQNPRAFS